jgi:transcriptional antiterminator RfaH
MRLEPHRERLALHTLGIAGYTTYLPRIKTQRHVAGRPKPFEITSALFPGYCFVLIELQWHSAQWSPGVVSFIMDCEHPARVPDRVIEDLRGREVNGYVVLPKQSGFQRGDKVRVIGGAFAGQLAIYQDMRPHERVAVLLTMLGGATHTELSRRHVERA